MKKYDYHFIKTTEPYWGEWKHDVYIKSDISLEEALKLYEEEYEDERFYTVNCYILKGELIKSTELPEEEPTILELFNQAKNKE